MRTLKIVAVCAALLASACAAEEDGPPAGASLTIDNDSSFTMIEINLSPVNQTSWGVDLLGAEVLEPGDTFIVSQIDCDIYDIRMIDEDNDTCVLPDVDLCFDNSIWQLDNAELAACQF